MTYQVNVLHPKADRLLKDLAAMNLISISSYEPDSLMGVVKRIRKKAGQNPPTLAEITQEVEIVRTERYARTL